MQVNVKKLLECQRQAQLTGAQLADMAGLRPQSFYALVYRGTCAMPTLTAIASALNIDVSELVNQKGR